MGRVTIKGIHRIRRKLATGREVEYHYAWRGGPRFWTSTGKIPRDGPDYFAAYTAALDQRSPSHGLFREVILDYLGSPEFKRLKPRSQDDINTSIKHRLGIDARFGDAPIGAFERPEIRRIAYRWRDQFKPRQADHMMAHLSGIVSWARERGYLNSHQLQGYVHLYSADRSEIIWTETEIEAFVAGAPAYVSRILIAATETGLRPGDLIRLSRAHIQKTPQGQRIVMRTGKRNRMVSIPITPKMQAVLDGTPRDRLLILANEQGGKWSTQDSLGKTVSKWRDRLDLRDELRLYDARGTAATRLFQADATLREIGLAMGWSPAHTAKMIEVYVHLNPGIADSILQKLAKAEQA